KDQLKAVKKAQEAFAQAQQELEAKKLEEAKQAKQMELIAEAEEKDKQRLHESIENQLDREKDIYIAEIKALGTQSLNNPDVNENNVPDIIEIGKLSLAQIKENYNKVLKERDLSLKERDIKIKEKEQKRKEIESKEELKLKKEALKIDKENQKNDLQIEKLRLQAAKVKSRNTKK
ncbi:MAG: hypothetical protein QXJ28_03390, partial [Candidatus Pacearchaeota archaeon]